MSESNASSDTGDVEPPSPVGGFATGSPGRVPLAIVTDEGPRFSPEAISLITGISVDAICAEGVRSIEALPLAWVQAARRRSSEAAAVTGTVDALTALRYWAAREFNVELIVCADGLYMPSDIEDPDGR